MVYRDNSRRKPAAPVAGDRAARAVGSRRRRRGGFVIIWGRRSILSRDPAVAPNFRACPGCRRQARLIGMISKRWFTFFFCPIFPTGPEQRFVQCSACGGKFTGIRMQASGAAGMPPGMPALPGAMPAPMPPAPKGFPWLWVVIPVPVLAVLLLALFVVMHRNHPTSVAGAGNPISAGQLSTIDRSQDDARAAAQAEERRALDASRKAEAAAAAKRAADAAAAKHAQELADREQTPEHIAQWLQSPDTAKRRTALTALAKMTVPEALREQVRKGLCDISASNGDSGARGDAARLLADYGEPGDVSVLLTLADAPDLDKRYVAVACASALILDPSGAMRVFDAHTSDKRFPEAVSAELGRHGAKAEAAGLAMLTSPVADVRHAALSLLKRVGSRASLDTIKAAQLKETDKKVQGRFKSTISDIEKR